MKRTRTYERICRFCRKSFTSYSKNAQYCPDCKSSKVIQEKKKQITHLNQMSITEIAVEADKLNMTYGQYVAKMEGINGLY